MQIMLEPRKLGSQSNQDLLDLPNPVFNLFPSLFQFLPVQPPPLNSLAFLQPANWNLLPSCCWGTDGTRVQQLSEVKSNDVERAGLGREQGAVPCCPLVLSLLPAAMET